MKKSVLVVRRIQEGGMFIGNKVLFLPQACNCTSGEVMLDFTQ